MVGITHLLVDLDGTLVNGDRPSMRLEFFNRVISQWKPHGSFFKAMRAFRKMRRAVEAPPNGVRNDLRMIRAFSTVFEMEEEKAKEFLEDTIRSVFPQLRHHFAAVPGAKSFIEWSKNKFQLILATNPIWIPEIVEMRARWGDVDFDAFQSFTHARRMHSCKPRIEYYQELLDQEGLKPEQCFLIGNDVRKDLPASRVGIQVFLLNKQPGHDQSEIRSLEKKEGFAKAWEGNYQGLRTLLGAVEVSS